MAKQKLSQTEQKAIVAATGRPDYSEIARMFADSCEQADGPEASPSGAYWDGVRQALGWVLGEYSDDPKQAI